MPTGYPHTPEDFFAFFERRGPDECWPWLHRRSPLGYGLFKLGGKGRNAHVWAYELMIGPVPMGPNGRRLNVDHLCHSTDCTVPARECPHRLCVNPAHLEPKTAAANVLRGNSPIAANARKEACPSCGGPYTIEILTGNREGRRCKPCQKIYDSAKHRRYRLAAIERAGQGTESTANRSAAQ